MATGRIAAISFENIALQKTRTPIPWIWDGLVAEEAVTLLSGPEKTGQTVIPSAENKHCALRRALNALRVIAGLPAAVLLLHQSSAARSRSRPRRPVTVFADILIEIQVPPGDHRTRRRHFQSVGRYP